MKSYFSLQLKRYFRVLPFLMAVAVLLSVTFTAVYAEATKKSGKSSKAKRFKVAITGDCENEFLQLGIVAVKHFDNSKYALEILEMTEEKAEKALEKGSIAAYLVLPKGFMDDMLLGRQPEKIKYITTSAGTGMVTLFKNELTTVVTNMVVYSEKGVYGLMDAMKANGIKGATPKGNQLNLEYIELILNRRKSIWVYEYGVADGLNTLNHLACGLVLMLLMLLGIPFGMVAIRQDNAISRLLLSRGYSVPRQFTGEFFAHYISLFIVAVTAVVSLIVSTKLWKVELSGIFTDISSLKTLIVPVAILLLMLTAFNLLVFELSGNMVSGVLIHFFSTLALCYISGSIFPITFFPDVVQKFATFLPTSGARKYLVAAITESGEYGSVISVLIYLVVFFVAALCVRGYKTRYVRG